MPKLAIDPAILRAMQAAGATVDVIIAAVEAACQVDAQRREHKRAGNAERQARYREKRRSRKSNARNALPAVTPPIEELHTPGEISPNGETHDSAGPFPKPDWADAAVWADWLDVRKAKKARNTATAYRQFLVDVGKLADDEWPPGKLLEHAVARSWAGIYDPRGKSNDRKSASNDGIQNPYARVAARQAAGVGQPSG